MGIRFIRNLAATRKITSSGLPSCIHADNSVGIRHSIRNIETKIPNCRNICPWAASVCKNTKADSPYGLAETVFLCASLDFLLHGSDFLEVVGID